MAFGIETRTNVEKEYVIEGVFAEIECNKNSFLN